jgi:hypothetical protein
MASTIPTTSSTAPPTASNPAKDPSLIRSQEIRVYGHSNIFYWWPVWLTGFIMAALTYADGHVLLVVPQGTQLEANQPIPGEKQTRDVLVAPPGESVPPLPGAKNGENSPGLRIAANNNLGVVFVGVLLMVIVISNYVFRGLVSVVVLALIAVAVLTIALFGQWDNILNWLGGLDIRMNAEGYLAISIPLLAIWLFTTFVYDHYTYMIVTLGQVRIRESIGEGEVVVDSGGILLDKKRNDVFRHWLLGCGAGDLHIKTGGPSNLNFEFHNVLLIGAKLNRIQNLLREKEVETAV